MVKLFRVLLLTVAVVGILAEIPFEDLNFKMYSYDGVDFKDEVNRQLSAATKVATHVGNVANTLSVVPYLRYIMKPISMAMSVIKDTIWKKTLVSAIAEETHRLLMKQAFTEMRSRMITVSQDFVTLQQLGNNLSDTDKSSKVQNMYDKLSDINNMFIQRDSIFRQYPRFAYLPLAALAPIVSLLHPVYTMFTPVLAQHSFISCRLLDNLREYQFLLLPSRLKGLVVRYINVEYMPPEMRLLNSTDKMAGEVLYQEYSRDGYKHTPNDTVPCGHIGCAANKMDHDAMCLTDVQVKQKIFVESEKNGGENCILGYAEFLRSSIERSFQPHIDLQSTICNEMRDRRKPTGFGWWTVAIIGMEAYTKRNSDAVCDQLLVDTQAKLFSTCDPYAMVFINGEKVFQSTSASNRNESYVMQTFESKRIPKHSEARFEVWDSDVIGKDACLVVQKSISDLADHSVKLQEGKNFIMFTSIWRDHYADDGEI